MIKQTAGRNTLGEFAPKFAELNDDVLFGEVWSREAQLSPKLRSIVTVTALVSKGLVDSSFQHHLEFAKQNGVTREELAEILTHLAFYAGWPNAWAAFRMAKEVYCQADDPSVHGGFFGLGEPNTAFAQYFIGNSYLNPLTDPESEARRCGDHPRRSEALAWSKSPRLVQPPGAGNPRRGDLHRMAGACGRRGIPGP